MWFAAYGNSIVHWAATLSISVFLPFFCVPYLFEGNCTNILYFIPDARMEFCGENLYRARRKKRKFFCQSTSNDPYSARLLPTFYCVPGSNFEGYDISKNHLLGRRRRLYWMWGEEDIFVLFYHTEWRIFM